MVVVAALRAGNTPSALGYGLPRATFHQNAGVFELRGLSGGAGFGVQAELTEPFKDAGTLVQGTWRELVVWLCEHWDIEQYGDPWEKSGKKRLRVTFEGDVHAIGLALRHELGIGLTDAMAQARKGVAAATLAIAAGACRAARTANARIDFDVDLAA